MAQRPTAMLLLLIFIVQTMVGGVYGGAVLCFGGHHDHAEAVADESCAGHCAHSADHARVRVTGDAHDDDCDCTDTRLDDVEYLLAKSGSDDHAVAVSVLTQHVYLQVSGDDRVMQPRGPPGWLWGTSPPPTTLCAWRSVCLIL